MLASFYYWWSPDKFILKLGCYPVDKYAGFVIKGIDAQACLYAQLRS